MALLAFRSSHLTTARLEAFSDGVLAVAITLLALDLKLPPGLAGDAEIWRATIEILPAFAAWIVSFAFVLTIWINHHYLFDKLKHVDRGLLWLNGFFLLTVTLIPFPTSLVGQYPGRTAPLALLSGTMLLASLSFTLMRLYTARRPDLRRGPVARGEERIALIRSALGPAIYACAFVVSFRWPPAAVALQVVALLIFVLGPPNVGGDAGRAGDEAA